MMYTELFLILTFILNLWIWFFISRLLSSYIKSLIS